MNGTSNDKLHIFLSYKLEDYDKAKHFVDELKGFARDTEFHLSDTLGGEWNKEIQDNIEKSHILFLLFIEPTLDWDWCLYETGLFRGMKKIDTKVFCFHDPNTTPPGPLRLLNTVSSDIGKLKDFFTKFFRTKDYTDPYGPINPDITDENILQIAENINKIIVPETVVMDDEHFTHFMYLHVSGIDKERHKISDDTIIESDRDSMRMFGLGHCTDEGKNWTWSEFKKEIRENVEDVNVETGWIDRMEFSLYNAYRSRKFDHVQLTFRSVENENIYRPVISRKIKYIGGMQLFYIPFYQEYSEDGNSLDRNLSILLKGLYLASRFRTEVVDKFIGKANYTLDSEEKIANLCKRLEGSMQNIINASDMQGFLTEDKLVSAFDTGEEKEIIKSMYKEGNLLLKQIIRATKENDCDSIKTHLMRYKEINQEFMAMASLQIHDTIKGITRSSNEDPIQSGND